MWLGKVRLREKACPGPPPTTISISYAEKLSLLSISISFSWNEAHGKNAQTSPEKKLRPRKTPGLVKIFDNFEKKLFSPRFFYNFTSSNYAHSTGMVPTCLHQRQMLPNITNPQGRDSYKNTYVKHIPN